MANGLFSQSNSAALCVTLTDLPSASYRYGLLKRKNKVFAGAGIVML